MTWTTALVLATAALAAATSASAELRVDSGDGSSYVVQLHTHRDADVALDATRTRSQVMTLASGQRFECFVPLTAATLAANAEMDKIQATDHPLQGEDAALSEAQAEAAFLAFGRTAVQKIRPKCVQFVDMADNWVYEVCPGVLVRRVSLRLEPKRDQATANDGDADELSLAADEDDDITSADRSETVTTERNDRSVRSYEVVELGHFESDSSAPALAYADFVGATTQERVHQYKKPLYTQTYRLSTDNQEEDDDDASSSLQVQFLCSASAVDDTVAGVQWRKEPTAGDSKGATATRTVAAFLVLSRVFCDPEHADEGEFKRFTVPSLLQPLVDARTCVKRTEGWWTYEFCFGRSLRQYHRDNEGKLTAEFSLGTFDAGKNDALSATGRALVMEHIDATHDVARPAFVELYDHGTHCKEFDHYTPRRAKVYYYCSHGGVSHHILAVKETQTCAYAIKVSTSAVCDHPHFLSDEQKREADAEVVHCLPLEGREGQEGGRGDVAVELGVPAAGEQQGSSGKVVASDEL